MAYSTLIIYFVFLQSAAFCQKLIQRYRKMICHLQLNALKILVSEYQSNIKQTVSKPYAI